MRSYAALTALQAAFYFLSDAATRGGRPVRPARRGCARERSSAGRPHVRRGWRGSRRGSRAQSRQATRRRDRARTDPRCGRCRRPRPLPRAAARAAAPGCASSRARRCRRPRCESAAWSAGRSNLSSWVSTTTAVPMSGWTCANASSGQATMSSSALGIRSRVAKRARASATIVVHPSSFAACAERFRGVDGAVDEQPRRRRVDVGEDGAAVRARARGCDRCAARRGRALRARRGRPGRRAVLAHEELRAGVLALRTVSTTARLPSSTTRCSSSKTLSVSLQRLDEDVDLAAAREPDSERHVVGDPVRQELRQPRQRAPPAPRGRRRSRRSRRRREPASSPLSLTASFEPTGRGAERRVATTVATATFSPRPRQRSISGSSSFTVAM